jgi:hypothetical protein
VWFILEFHVTQILISTASGFECIGRLIKVTDNNDARWKLEIKCTVDQQCTIYQQFIIMQYNRLLINCPFVGSLYK